MRTLQMVITDYDQPYHGRIMVNGEPIWWTENYSTSDAVLRAFDNAGKTEDEEYEVADERSNRDAPPPEGHISERSPEAQDTTEGTEPAPSSVDPSDQESPQDL